MPRSATAPVTPDSLFAIDTLLDEEERAVRETVRRLVDTVIKPHVADWYEHANLPVRDVAVELGRVGLLGMSLTGYGCAGMSATAYGLACLELEAADSGVRSLVSVQSSLAMHSIHAYGSDEQRASWLPQLAAGVVIGCFGLTEADAGSNPAGMRTTARRDGSDWLIDGTKMWITNGSVADVAVVWARTEDGIRGFLVPTSTPGFAASTVKGKLSLRASVTSELVLDGVRLPADAVLPGAQGLGSALGALNEARFGIVFGALGAARDCLLATLDYAAGREQFGRPIAGFQLTQAKLAGMAVRYGTGVLLALHLGRTKDAGGLTPQLISAGKLNNVRESLAIARTCRTVLGANGISGEYPVMRHANNLESVLTYEGTSEIHALVLGQALTGLPAFS